MEDVFFDIVPTAHNTSLFVSKNTFYFYCNAYLYIIIVLLDNETETGAQWNGMHWYCLVFPLSNCRKHEYDEYEYGCFASMVTCQWKSFTLKN